MLIITQRYKSCPVRAFLNLIGLFRGLDLDLHRMAGNAFYRAVWLLNIHLGKLSVAYSGPL